MDAVDTCPMDIMGVDTPAPEPPVPATKGPQESLPESFVLERKAEISAADVRAALSLDPVESEPAAPPMIIEAKANVSLPT